MKYTWLFIASFFCLPVAICHAETKAIKDAEFVIEKQKNNRVNQEQRLFFKAPTRTTKSANKPLATIQALTLEDITFEPAPETYRPFSLATQGNSPTFNHYCRLGIGSLLLPYVEVGLANYCFGQSIWSMYLGFTPELWNNKSREAALGIQGQYGIESWLLQPSIHYQHSWYKYNDTITDTRRLDQAQANLSVKQANTSSTQDGQVKLHLLKDHDKKIHEQLLTLKYKWMKELDNWSLKVASYNDIAGYTNDHIKQTRFILSAAPSFYLHLFKPIQLKVGVRISYHNDPIPGKIPRFDLYPMAKIAYRAATWLVPYMGIKGMGVGGSVIPLHLHDIVAKNPFIAPNWKLSHQHQYFKLYGGSKGVVAPHCTYHLHVVYQRLKNQSRILSDTTHQIKLAYHPSDYNLCKATGLFDYRLPNGKLGITIQGTYHLYFDHTAYPVWWYHKPVYKFKQALFYKPHAKVLLNGKLHLHGPTTLKNIEGTATALSKTINLSLGVDYAIFNRLTAFIMVSNLLNRTHITYTGYPDKKINITGGLEYKW
ncbi:hypothetical protein [Candidatus Cardinium sp. TP]|uniref:hypothetical protein n=1 Tax=Candidatus Cardinium sp. TP TaxID=2961955 RepID=UPI0021AF7BAE|nr:hypothetical protein [Candidatus Cardinium sp. TP]MCT4696932.1 hypothetical protein [Candidatus Cardinium sp. TP]